MERREQDYLKEQFEAVFDVSYDGIWICDGDGVVLRLNRAAAQINGVRPEDVIGRHISVLAQRGVNDVSVTMKVIEERRPVTIMQRAFITGKKLLVTASPIFDRDGDIVLIVTNDRDITELDHLRHAFLEKAPAPDKGSDELDALAEGGIIGRSPVMRRVLTTALHVARFKTTVLITGPSGTGKGLVAQTVHRNSDRAGGPFIRVDCGAVPPGLFESEIFGYEEGAFTGAKKSGKPGLFEQADGGTLFLDEIGLVPYDVQHKLLRFLENGELVRVGGAKPVRVDVRLVAATNADLEAEVAADRFRTDLYYRLSVVPIQVPPLTRRLDDLPLLVNHFLKKFGQIHGATRSVSPPALEAMMAYDWPGNVRELENLVERLVVMTPGPVIERVDLPAKIAGASQSPDWPRPLPGQSLKDMVRDFEAAVVRRAFEAHGSQRGAARALGISQASVGRKLRTENDSKNQN